MRFKTTTAELFWDRVDKSGGPDACWPWKGCLNKYGYGQTTINFKNATAHRAAFQYTNGPIPEGMLVCHRCDRRDCCNPIHLFLGTPADNAADMVFKGRQSKGIARSLANGCRKLTPKDVLEMRRMREEQGIPVKQLAVHFGVTVWTANDIVYRRTWKSI